MNNKNQVIIWVLIVVAVVVFLVFFTTKGNKGEQSSLQNNTSNENTDTSMQQEQIDPTKVKITVLEEGAGDSAKAGDIVVVNYTGRFTDGTAFDSNVDPAFNHAEPFVFQLGTGRVIKGWDVGIAGMKPGAKRVLEIAPDYAYGERGAGEVIPPNTTLVFEVELISIVNKK